MIRKIIKQGHNTLTITLPSEWTKRFNLEAGKENPSQPPLFRGGANAPSLTREGLGWVVFLYFKK